VSDREADVVALPVRTPLVLVTVGTDHHRFDRLVAWADSWAASVAGQARVFVQTGTSAAPRSCMWSDYVERTALSELVAQCSVFVCHGGPGTIAEARRAGFVPIVVPRRQALGEHVDDHQVRFCARIAQSGYIHVADTQDDFVSLLGAALEGSPAFRISPGVDDSSPAAARFAQAADVLLASRARRRPRRPDRRPLARRA
jgi:UDP-N-acetylglucosamine transferase subunit ALG13